jgi:hypothetical protein
VLPLALCRHCTQHRRTPLNGNLDARFGRGVSYEGGVRARHQSYPPPGGNLQGFFPHAGGRSLAKPCAVRVFVWLGPPYCAARNPGRGVRGYTYICGCTYVAPTSIRAPHTPGTTCSCTRRHKRCRPRKNAEHLRSLRAPQCRRSSSRNPFCP